MDVIIKDVPVGAETEVRNLAMEAIERFLNAQYRKESSEIKSLKEQVDSIRVANSLTMKYRPEEKPVGIIKEIIGNMTGGE